MTKEQEKVSKNLSLLAKSSLIVFIGIFLSKLFTYLYKIVIGRYYGPEEYGLFSLALVTLGFFMAFASFGLPDGLNRFLSIFISKKDEKNFNYLISFSNKIFLFTSLVSAVLLFLFSNFISNTIFHNPNLSIYLKIFSIVIPFQIYSYLYYSIIRSYEKISIYSFGINILQNFSKLVLIILLISLGFTSSKSVSISYLSGIFFMALFGFIYCKYILKICFSKKCSTTKDKKKSLSKEVLSYSWPLLFFGVINSLIFWIDTFSIGVLMDSYWVGIYNSAIPLAVLLMFSSEIFMQLFFPMITKELFSKNYLVSSELSKQVTKWIFIINLPILSLIIIFPGVFINFFWGEEYLLVINSLIFLSIGYFFFSLASVGNSILSSVGKSKLILSNLILVSIINLSLNLLLIPIYGINGAAFSTLISLFGLSILIFFETYYFTKILPIRRKMFNVLFSAIISTSVLYFFAEKFNFGILGLILFAIIYSIIYTSLLFLTKSLDENDFNILKNCFL